MTFNIRCPHCQKPYAAQAHWIGKRIRCKQCGKAFAVEQPIDHDAPASCSRVGIATLHQLSTLGFDMMPWWIWES